MKEAPAFFASSSLAGLLDVSKIGMSDIDCFTAFVNCIPAVSSISPFLGKAMSEITPRTSSLYFSK